MEPLCRHGKSSLFKGGGAKRNLIASQKAGLRRRSTRNDLRGFKKDNIILEKRKEDNKLIGVSVIHKNAIMLLCVAPEYRRQGIMGDMIKYAAGICRMKGTQLIFLYPADDKLYSYYGKLGFREMFRERYYIIEKKDLEKYKGSRYFNTALSYEKMRECIPSESFCNFDGGYLDFSLYCAKKYGFMICASFDDEDYVIVTGSKKDGRVIVDEAISSDGNYSHILSVIADIEGETYSLKTPVCIEMSEFDSEIKKAGMLLPLGDSIPEDENIYLGQPCM